MPHSTFDDKDQELLEQRQKARYNRKEPQVGDYIEMEDGTLRRFTYNWDKSGLQTNDPEFGEGQYFLNESGTGSFSGSLDPIVRREYIINTSNWKPARFWFFHHNRYEANNGVNFEIPVRVWKEVKSQYLAKELLENIDPKLLAQQRLTFLNHLNNEVDNCEVERSLQGIVHLLDAITDYQVDVLGRKEAL